MGIMIEPSKELIRIWMDIYVPEKDLLFLREEDLRNLERYLNRVLVIPKKEFFNHSSYTVIQLVNSFEYWNISKEVQYIVVAESDWLSHQSKDIQKQISNIQLQINRGLILPLSLCTDSFFFPEEYLVKDSEREYIVLQSKMWRRIPYETKENLLKVYAKQWDDWTCYELPEQTPLHLQKYANTFPAQAGGNCLSATLFALTKQEWIINEWVHPRTFFEGLKRANYFNAKIEDIQNGDVVVWVNEEGIIQHASYHISQNLFFNKNGQTFFNPWIIIDWNELELKWKKYRYEIYRIEK
ncbi:hypothetical protein [Paenibacillus gallinarum]|uniref:NlpC/P60 domain-containing protein n=1 Tax=Paenibacillus gallinarum TaxID=2762232 RepID=A0ABR8T6K1_9BACL|nr:hypothetical protein [Paenibacillus gallinarum]MBD7971357.1 hypothetical protein [Paenibacillus gallinarum]